MGDAETAPRERCDKAQSRRIEIKFSLKDEDAIKRLAQILAGGH